MMDRNETLFWFFEHIVSKLVHVFFLRPIQTNKSIFMTLIMLCQHSYLIKWYQGVSIYAFKENVLFLVFKSVKQFYMLPQSGHFNLPQVRANEKVLLSTLSNIK